MGADLITICVPTYRRPTYLTQTLHSCLIQDYRPLEIDIADSSPNDDTERLIGSLMPPEGISLRYHRLSPETDPQDKMNALFRGARGRRLLVMHDDDAFLPGAVVALNQAFDSAPDVVLAYGREEIVNEAGELLPKETLASNALGKRILEESGIRRDLLVCALYRQVPPNGFLIDSEVMRRFSYRSRAEIGLAEDTDLGIRLALAYRDKGAFAFIGQLTTQRRLSRSSMGWTSPDTCWQLYDELAAMSGLTQEEERARDWTLMHLARSALRENAVAGRRRAALRILLSRHYPRNEAVAKTLYSIGLVALPSASAVLRRWSSVG